MSNFSGRGALDRAIDRAVRDMTQHDPRPGFSRRVLRRIERPGLLPWRLAPSVAFARLGAAAALALVVIAAVALLRQPTAPEPSERHMVVSAPATPPQADVQVTQEPSATRGPAAPAAAAPSAMPVPRERRREATPESIFGPRRGRVEAASVPGSPALDPVPPLPEWMPAADPADPLAPIVIPPIEIAPITVAPLIVKSPGR